MMTIPYSLILSLLVGLSVFYLSANAAAPDAIALEQVPIARAIANHLKAGVTPTIEEKAAIKRWLDSDNAFLQALGAWLLARIPTDAPELDENLAARSRTYAEISAGFAKVATVQRATRAFSAAQRKASLKTLTSDTNPYAAFEALRALADIDVVQAVAKARELYKNADHPLRPYLAIFLRDRGDNVPPQPIPGSLYKTLLHATSGF